MKCSFLKVAGRRGLAALAVAAAAANAGCGPNPEGAQEIYSLYCQRCHGAEGTGDPRSVGLNPRLNLRRSEMLGDGVRPLVYQRIKNGFATMPAFGHQLSHSEISELAEFVLNEFGTADSKAAPAGRDSRDSDNSDNSEQADRPPTH